jgi:acyl carrier protein
MTTAADITQVILSCLEPSIRMSGLSAAGFDEETDLRKVGLVDSLGFIRLLSELERRMGRAVDISAIDPERLTHLGTLARHIAAQQR